MNSKHLLAISGLAIGIATGISAAPAGAVILAPGSILNFSGTAVETAGTIIPTAAGVGSSFSAVFNPNPPGAALVNTASGSFSGLIPTGASSINSTTTAFTNVGLSTTVPTNFDFVSQSPLTFDFGTAGTLTLDAGAFFLATPSAGTPSTSTNFNIYNVSTAPGAPNFFGTFVSGGDVNRVKFDQFQFSVANVPAGLGINNYNLQVSAAPVPEPFTIIGTLVGGTAALRLRKKLSSSAKN
jgi:hypothetical protein